MLTQIAAQLILTKLEEYFIFVNQNRPVSLQSSSFEFLNDATSHSDSVFHKFHVLFKPVAAAHIDSICILVFLMGWGFHLGLFFLVIVSEEQEGGSAPPTTVDQLAAIANTAVWAVLKIYAIVFLSHFILIPWQSLI